MRGNRRQKRPEDLQNRRGGQDRRLVVPETANTKNWPSPPKGLGPLARGVWNRLKKAFVAGAIDPHADAFLLRRYITLVDLWDKTLQQVKREGTVLYSSRGGKVHPLLLALEKVGRDIERIEEQAGLSPLARFRLGITALEEQRRVSALRGNGEPRKPRPMEVLIER